MSGLVGWQSKRSLAGTCLLAVLATFLAACGEETDPNPAPPPTAETPATRAPATPIAQVPDTPVIPADPAVAIVEVRELNEWYRAVLINPAAISDPRQLEGLARPLCEGLTVCQAGLWYDVNDMPVAMPVSAVQLRDQAFGFGRTAAGVERALWNCNVFPQFEAVRLCLPRLLQ